jgi:hypothetical protein
MIMNTRLFGWTVVPSAIAFGFVLTSTASVSTQQVSPPAQRDFARELANKMSGTYVVASTGALLMQEPTSRQMSGDLQKALRDANTAVGSLEFYQADRRTGPGATPSRELAQDVADLGFDLLGTGDAQGGEAAMRTGLEALAGMGILVARADRQPIFQNLAQGRAAFIAGTNPVRLSTAKYVTAEQLAQLKAIRDSIVAHRNDPDVSRPIGVPTDLPDQVTIFSDTFMVGPVTGEIRQETSQPDRQATLMAVRNAKEFADFVTFSMPLAAAVATTQQHYVQDVQPGKATIDLAHELVDNGMDVYVGQGNHVMQGIEIYKGRPIFYNPGDLSVHRGTATSATAGVAYIATSKYQDGILQEVRIHPVDLGIDPARRVSSKMGVPMTPSAEVAAKILADLQKASDPFGTKIVIENGVGVIRVPKEATVPIGQNIRDFGAPAGGGAGRGGRGGGRGAGGL